MTGPHPQNRGLDLLAGASEKRNGWPTAGWLGFAAVAVAFVALAAITWRKWPDALVDFGNQLYIPWRLNEGAVLYRDLFYFSGGPLSQYFNALLFKLFGVSFSTVIAANLLLSATVLACTYRRFLAASDAVTATMICLGIVIVFLFSEYTVTGNYNFIAPYSHEAVHGVLVSLLVIGWLADWLTHQRLRAAWLAGFGTGLVFLTKPDIFVALFACAAAALVVAWTRQRALRCLLKALACFGSAFVMPPLFFLLLFLRTEAWHASLRSVVFGWLPMFLPAVRDNPYYLKSAGLDAPAAHVQEMVTHFCCAALAILLYATVFRWLGRWQPSHAKSPWLIWLVLFLPLLYWANNFQWVFCGSSLPLWCLATIGFLVWRLRQAPLAPRLIFPLLWSVFALCLMFKLGVFARLGHYGFALAMPAFAITIYFLLSLLPETLETRYQVPAKYLRALFVPLLLAAFAFLLGYSNHMYAAKSQPIGKAGDTIITLGSDTELGEAVKIALDWMDRNLPRDATLAVLPNGVMLNYLTRHANSTPCVFWDPIAMAVFGQAAMTARFEAAPPDYVLLLEQDNSEFGFRYLGVDPAYGAGLMQWIKQNYKVALIIGNEPLRDGRFGMEFLQRLPLAPAAAKDPTKSPAL